MGIVDRVKTKYLTRIEDLINAGVAVPIKTHTRAVSVDIDGRKKYIDEKFASLPEFVEWRTSCIAVLDKIIPSSSLLRKTVESMVSLGREPYNIDSTIGFLRSVKNELQNGSLDSLALQIETEILSDYLDQATHVLSGSQQEPSHIAAAVIAGASLERALRALCASLVPEEPIISPKGAKLAMSALIDALKARQAFNELQAKHLRSWAAIRNEAAHGEFNSFNRQQVELMVSGIETFIKDHVR